MQIECPHCSAINNISKDTKINCGSCKEEVSGYKYKKSGRAIVTTFSAIVIGTLGYSGIKDYIFSDSRYPVLTEYSIIDACLNSHEKPLQGYLYSSKRKVCSCSLRKTMDDISYKEFDSSTKHFIRTFEKNAEECAEERRNSD